MSSEKNAAGEEWPARESVWADVPPIEHVVGGADGEVYVLVHEFTTHTVFEQWRYDSHVGAMYRGLTLYSREEAERILAHGMESDQVREV